MCRTQTLATSQIRVARAVAIAFCGRFTRAICDDDARRLLSYRQAMALMDRPKPLDDPLKKPSQGKRNDVPKQCL